MRETIAPLAIGLMLISQQCDFTAAQPLGTRLITSTDSGSGLIPPLIGNGDGTNPMLTTDSGSGLIPPSIPWITDSVLPLNGTGNVMRDELSYETLMGYDGGFAWTSYVDYSAMALPSDAADPRMPFSGSLILGNASQSAFQVMYDPYSYGADAERGTLPPIEADIVSFRSHLIPFIRYNQRTSHQYWEYILSAGRVWAEDQDHGMMRAAIPFTLTQKNENCAHNGVFMFLFSNEDGGTISKVWYQITQETCAYFKANFWGFLEAEYRRNEYLDSSPDPISVIEGYLSEIEGRIPTKPISEISADYPAVDWTEFSPSANGVDNVTMNGVYFNGIHYIGAYPTRSGQHPFPEQLIVPSYSTAKSSWLGVAGMYLQHRFGGDTGGFMKETIDLGLDFRADRRLLNKWRDVTNNNCIDMATGNYDSASFEVDENGGAMLAGFFMKELHSEKFSFCTNHFPRKAAPGTTWVYHSSDHYLCGFSAKRFLRDRTDDSNADIHDVLYDDVYGALGCSDVLKEIKRTYGAENQPFGYNGLYYTRDDILKIAKLMNNDDGMIGGQRVLDAQELRSAMQLTEDKGVKIGETDDEEWYYNNRLWSVNMKNCSVAIPYMSGYGGIHVSMYPNGAIYHYFSDDHDHSWTAAANEMNNLDPFCVDESETQPPTNQPVARPWSHGYNAFGPL